MAEKVKPYDPNEIINRPICPLTWLTNSEHCVHCDNDRCAWFNVRDGICGMLSLSIHMRDISENLSRIVEYIYHRRDYV